MFKLPLPKNHTHRTMIGAGDLIMNSCIDNPAATGSIDNEIVDSPADIFRPCIEAVAPPGIPSRRGIKFPERIDISSGSDCIHPSPLLWGKTGIVHIGFGIGQVDLFVGHVKISAKHQRFTAGEAIHMIEQRPIELLLEG